MHCHDMSDIAHVHFVRILFLQNQPNEVRVLSVSGQFATTTNSPAQNSPCTNECQIATGGDDRISAQIAKNALRIHLLSQITFSSFSNLTGL